MSAAVALNVQRQSLWIKENVVIMYFAVLLLAIWSINGDARQYNDYHCARCVCEWICTIQARAHV